MNPRTASHCMSAEHESHQKGMCLGGLVAARIGNTTKVRIALFMRETQGASRRSRPLWPLTPKAAARNS